MSSLEGAGQAPALGPVSQGSPALQCFPRRKSPSGFWEPQAQTATWGLAWIPVSSLDSPLGLLPLSMGWIRCPENLRDFSPGESLQGPKARPWLQGRENRSLPLASEVVLS